MDALPRRRRVAVQLAQLEHLRIEEVIDDALSAAFTETAHRLSDQHVGIFDRAVERGREVFAELAREVRRADAGTGHAIADCVASDHYNVEQSPSMMPRSELRPRARSFTSSHSSDEIRPTP